MKPKHDKFPKHGGNPFDHSGRGAGDCPKCGVRIERKSGFRTSALKCPKCHATVGK